MQKVTDNDVAIEDFNMQVMDARSRKGEGHLAMTIMIGNRFFYDFGKNGQAKTGWSLAVAKLFSRGSDVREVLGKIPNRRMARIVFVGVQS